MNESTLSTTRLTAHQARQLCKKIAQQAEDLRALLLQLRDGEGWRSLGYATWAACCEKEFGYTKRHANYLIQTDAVKKQVGEIYPTPIKDSHAKALARVPEGKRQAVLDAATEQAGDKPVTAVRIRMATEEVEQAAEVEPRKGVGVLRANEAIEILTRIPKNDPLRNRGFQIVTDWIKSQSKSKRKEKKERPALVKEILADVQELREVVKQSPLGLPIQREQSQYNLRIYSRIIRDAGFYLMNEK